MRFTVAILILVAGFAGCFGGSGEQGDESDEARFSDACSPALLGDEVFNLTGAWSQTLVPGQCDILPPTSIFVDVELPLTEGGAAATGARVHMGLWLPDVPNGTKIPIIADVGPYYSDGDVAATTPANRLGGFLIEQLVPHGFGVAQVSVFGSGQSNHCMDLMGRSEQLGIDAAVTYLGSQEWSNGNVGLIGRSYDGSTPWEAAMFGNEHLKTIAPISGLIGMYELMWRNGSAEFRGPIMHNYVYGQFGIDRDAEDIQTACPDYATGGINGLGAYLTGDHFAPQANDYWSERYFLHRAIENYNGSVYFIHGLQDWNVEPHMAFPAYQMLQDNGFEVKGLFGQWGHMYPDRPSEHNNLPNGRGGEASHNSVRWDWAQDLLEWFTYYLKEEGPKPDLHVEVQDNAGNWRVEETYPPTNRTRTVYDLSILADQVLFQPSFLNVGVGPDLTLDFEPINATANVTLSGNMLLHIEVTPTGPGGQIFAQLRDAETNQRFGHAIMDLRFHAGGKEMGVVVPGQSITAMMEFEALDAVLPAEHGLRLLLTGNGEDYLPSAVQDPITINGGELKIYHQQPMQYLEVPQPQV